jgi:hypothetical protein
VSLFDMLYKLASRLPEAPPAGNSDAAINPAAPRIGKPKTKPKPVVDPYAVPDGTSAAEWRAALQNEMMGSPRSNIRRGSDVPSDETVRREHAFAATMQRRERQQQRYRNQFAVDPITGRSNVR